MKPVKAWLTDTSGKKHSCKIEVSENIIAGEISPKAPISPRWMCMEFSINLEDKSILAHGFQSWTESFIADKDSRIKPLNPLARLLKIDRYGDYHFYKAPSTKGYIHTHEYFQMFEKSEGKEILFVGNLQPEKAYGIFEVDFNRNTLIFQTDLEGLKITPGETLKGIELYSGKSYKEYFSHRNLDCSASKNLTGWTSWYNYYTGISEGILVENLDAITGTGLKIDVFQIDDGFQNAVGDWLDINEKFPSGMKFLADSIKDKNLIPGLWLAPFACEKKSKIYKHDRKLLLSDKNGKPVSVGFNPGWSGIFYSLDIYSPEVRDYLEKVFSTAVNDWGYRLLKLDFLYAAAVCCRPGKTRAMVMHDGYSLLNNLKGKAKLLGCGAPLGPAAGLFEYMRIGADVAPYWEDKLLKKLHYRERVSTASSLSSTVNRSFLNDRAYKNDPDVFILRDTKEVKLSREQKDYLFKTNMKHGGLVFFSDDVRKWSDKTLNMVKDVFGTRT